MEGCALENKIVAHLRDARIHKGITRDFDPDHDVFHVLPAEGGGVPVRLSVKDLKALFFVKDFVGDAEFQARREWHRINREGRRLMVTFHDGEIIWGTSADYDATAAGFHLIPADPDDNNLRIFVVNDSVQHVEFVEDE
jgi:hypothetical protein